MKRLSGMGFALVAACSASCVEAEGPDPRDDDGTRAQIIDVVRREPGVSPVQRDAGALPPVPVRGGASSACSSLFDPARLHTLQVELSASELSALNEEFLRPRPDDDGSGLYNPWHPVVFKLGDEVRTDAMLRLKGDWSWKQTVALDPNPKAQFVIAFDRVNPDARFRGVARLELDMVRDDPTFLRERIGHHALRALGVPAVCASSMRLNLNGSYYGLFTGLEELRPEALAGLYPNAAGGALWKSGTQIETEGSEQVFARQEAWKASKTAADMRQIIDIDQALYAWAAEIVMNNADGYYGGNHNFYTYDHPRLGFHWLPTDLDSTFDYLDWEIHPIYWWEQHDQDQTAGHHFRIVMQDPALRARLVDAVERVLARWDVAALQARVDTWALQIADSVRDDPHRAASLESVAESTAWLRDTVQQRPAWLKPWIACERSGRGTDADRDGVPWCRDCNDQSAAQRPGAREVCGNGVDEDCNGLKDEGCAGTSAPTTPPAGPGRWTGSRW